MYTGVLHAPKALLFDMDGTLLKSTQRSDESWQQVCFQFAPRLGLSTEDLVRALRESIAAYRKDIEGDAEKQRRDRLEPFAVRTETAQAALTHFGRGDATLAAEMVRAYEALRDEYLAPVPHALETLETLRARGKRLGLLTNGNASYQRHKIERHHLAPLFDCILIEEEFGVAKPDTRVYRAALEQLQITPREAWMVGDNLALDVGAPQQLGIVGVWFDPDRGGLPAESSVHPDRIIHALPELLDLDEQAAPPPDG
jgi:putative hydrolase of the HAD superfamily